MKKAKKRINVDSICESHHVIPKSLGGELSEQVLLTLEEHLLAHRLLIDMTLGKDRGKMAFAYHRMKYGRQGLLLGLSEEEKQDRLQGFKEECSKRQLGKKHHVQWNENISKGTQGRRNIGPNYDKANKERKGRPINYSDYERLKRSLRLQARMTGFSKPWQNKINKNPEKIAKAANTHRGMKRPETSKKRMSVTRKILFEEGKLSYKGNRWYHNPTTKEMIFLPESSIPPNGFIKGKGSHWYHDPLTREDKEIFINQAIPSGYIKGKCKK